jgi:hypothetical protein
LTTCPSSFKLSVDELIHDKDGCSELSRELNIKLSQIKSETPKIQKLKTRPPGQIANKGKSYQTVKHTGRLQEK